MPKIIETITTKITAPRIDGINAIPAKEGPHEPSKLCPNQAPTKPATMLPSQPAGKSRLVSAPAIAPMIPPIINDQIHPNITNTPLVI